MPAKVTRPKPNKRPTSRAKKSAANPNSLRLWMGLAILGGLGLIAFVLLLRLLLPVLLLAGSVALGYWIWRTVQRHHQRQRRLQSRLNTQFYQLLKRQQGRVSALDFAMFTQTDGMVAQNYLNKQAQALSAYGETTIQGDIIYVFNLAAISQPTQQETARVAWAKQTWAQRVQFEQQQAAWISAKQMRSLRQLSQKAAIAQPVIPLPAPPDEYRDLGTGGRWLGHSYGVSPLPPKPIKSALTAPKQTARMAIQPAIAPKRQPAHLPIPASNRQTLRHNRAVVTIDVSAVRS